MEGFAPVGVVAISGRAGSRPGVLIIDTPLSSDSTGGGNEALSDLDLVHQAYTRELRRQTYGGEPCYVPKTAAVEFPGGFIPDRRITFVRRALDAMAEETVNTIESLEPVPAEQSATSFIDTEIGKLQIRLEIDCYRLGRLATALREAHELVRDQHKIGRRDNGGGDEQ